MLERPGPMGLSVAMLLLMGFFFVLPSAFRGARTALKNKENDIKDWLPAHFPETAELDWFADHFAGESFVLATWPGCHAGDQRLRLLEEKLLHESAEYRDHIDDSRYAPDERRARLRARSMGDELGLLQPGGDLTGWGGQDEKWLISSDGAWYYITPDGRLYRWDESINGPAALGRAVRRALGTFRLQGQLVTAFGKPSTANRVNPFYNDPSLLCAPLFQTVQTGATIAAELSAEDGPLWPIDLTDDAERPKVARRRALDRLTGTLFAPAVPPEFAWTTDAFAEVFAETDQLGGLPAGWESLVEETLELVVDSKFDSDAAPAEVLVNATTSAQTVAWYAVLDRLDLESPPQLTCLLVTLTDIAKDHLSYAIGRGTMGMPRGRLLELASQCGVHPPSPPSMAPPPFDRPPPESIGGLPPLRMGGPPVDNIAIDEEGTVTLVRLVGYCVALGVFLSYACFRSIKVTIMLFLVGGSSAMLAMAIVGWTGGRVDAILLSMPSLVYFLGLSGAIHVINYYRDEVRLRGRRGAATRALSHAVFPCALAALTTAIGLASLFTSNLKPISNFGLYAALGVISTLGVLFSYLPSALEVFAPKFSSSRRESETPAAPATAARHEPAPSELAQAWARVGGWITRHHAVVSVASLAVLAIASVGVLKIKTSVQLLKLFDSEARILKDYAWLEDNFGKLVPMEILIRMPPEIQREWSATADEEMLAALAKEGLESTEETASVNQLVQLNLLERVEAIHRVRKVVTRTLGEEAMDVVGQASSMDTFLQPLPTFESGFSLARSNYQTKLLIGRDDLLKSDYVKLERGGPMVGSELWRLSLRVSALSDVDYGLFIDDLKTSVTPVMQAYALRAAVLDSLASGSGKVVGKRVLVLGSGRVPFLDDAELVDHDGDQWVIDQRAVFLSTLHELLLAENLKAPRWLDVESPDLKVQPGTPEFERMLAVFDVVIDVRGIPTRTDAQTLMRTRGPAPFQTSDRDRFVIAYDLLRQPTTKAILSLPTGTNGPSRVPIFDVQRPDTPQVVFTGVVPVVYKAQRTLLGSLVESIILAFVLIGVVMIVLLNPGSFPFTWMQPAHLLAGLAAGAVSMIPNIFPVLLVFGLMGHLNSIFSNRFMVDIGTMMTASVAMGVAVDDTIHFLSWFRQFIDEGKTRVEAVIETYRRVGPAMTQTTIVGGLGLFVFALSTFTPTQRFGTLMLVMLAAALIGDLILLPALLAGPLGRCFKARSNLARREPDLATESAETAAHKVDSDSIGDMETVPVLRVHSPTTSRADQAHPTQRR
ncbi:MAG: MMPL family transporter [Planctomycetota bacterium]